MLTNGNWVVIDKKTGLAILELSDQIPKSMLNTDKYASIDILPYLCSLNNEAQKEQTR